MNQFKTIHEWVNWVRKTNNPALLNYHQAGKWVPFSSEDFYQYVKWSALGLVSLGIKKGDRIGLVAQPSPFWTFLDAAIICAGGINVPLFANIAEENFDFEIKQAEVRTVFFQGADPIAMIRHHADYFKTKINMDPDAPVPDSMDWNDFIELGKQYEKAHPEKWDQLMAAANPDDVVSIVYTSGSTGVPKGAMLTHGGLVSMCHHEAFYFDPSKDRYLSILPLAHIFGRTLNFIILAWGVSIFYFTDLKSIGKACQDVHPTILVVVPRLMEKVYARMLHNVEHAGVLKRTIGTWAFELAKQEDDSLYKQLLHPVADKVVYSALREALGGSIRMVVTGGAAMNPELQHFFMEIGVPIYEGWGMTEGCPGCVNRPGQNKVGTIGPPLPSVEVKISPEGEICMRGPQVMKGYYKNPEATAKVLDKENWLHTGDKGIIDSEGYVKLIGRLKEMFKTSTGEYVVPVPIEQELAQAPLIDWAMVIADKRKYASVLLFPNFELLETLKKQQNLSSMTDETFLNSPVVRKQMQELLEKVNVNLNHWEQIRAYKFVPYTLSIEKGELTPSMKLRREIIEGKFSEQIQTMYPGA